MDKTLIGLSNLIIFGLCRLCVIQTQVKVIRNGRLVISLLCLKPYQSTHFSLVERMRELIKVSLFNSLKVLRK